MSIDGRKLLLDHCTANLGCKRKVPMRCGLKKILCFFLSMLLEKYNATNAAVFQPLVVNYGDIIPN